MEIGDKIICLVDYYRNIPKGTILEIYSITGGTEKYSKQMIHVLVDHYISSIDMIGEPIIDGKRQFGSKERIDYFITFNEYRDRKINSILKNV